MGEGGDACTEEGATEGPVQAPAQDRPMPLWAPPSFCPLLSLTTCRGAGGNATAGPRLRPHGWREAVKPTPSPGEALGTCRVPWAAWSCSGSHQGPGISFLRAELPLPSCPPNPGGAFSSPRDPRRDSSVLGGLPPQAFHCLQAGFETRFPCSQSLNIAQAFSEVIRGTSCGTLRNPSPNTPSCSKQLDPHQEGPAKREFSEGRQGG